MNVHIEINPARLSILSIPREKSWIFSSSLLLLLYAEYHKSESDSFASDTESDSGSPSPHSLLDSCTSPLDATANTSFAIDNSSKDVLTPLISPTSPLKPAFPDLTISDNLFFHIAYSPNECTVVCESRAMQHFFKLALDLCAQLGYDDVVLLPGHYISFQIDSDGGYDHSRRIIELTKPLLDNGISLFFLLTHFNDMVLIPASARDTLDAIVSGNVLHPPPETPTPCPLIANSISPVIDSHTKLLLTGARLGATLSALLKSAQVIAQCADIPPYFAITRTAASEVLFVLPRSGRQRRRMGFAPTDIVGSAMDVIVPVTVDLRLVPLDSTGIVLGLALRLVDAVQTIPGDTCLYEMSYLSMARLGIVLIPRENIHVIAQILEHK